MTTPTPASWLSSGLPAQKQVAESRIRFLAEDSPAPREVRTSILASWQRSHEMQLPADRIEPPYLRDLRLDTPLTRSAEPVLRSLREQLEGQSVSVILTGPTGQVLSRLTGNSDLERHLDRVLLAPGFSYAEKFVGTNGIGTALEVGGPVHVFGHEHYAENLEDLACAGVPIHDPSSGRLVGAVDLTCWRKDAGALLLTLAKTTADQIRQAMLAEAGPSQLGLLQEYLRTCRRRAGIVVALNRDVVMLNDYARTVLDPTDQAALLAQATETQACGSLTSGQSASVVIELPSGQTARMHCREVRHGDVVAGVVVTVRLDPEGGRGRRPQDRASAPRMSLPGLVGSGPPWLHVSDQIEKIYRSGEWLAVEGEPGVGKLALLRAVQLRRQPVGRFVVVDAAEAEADPHWLTTVRQSLLENADTVVVRHVDALDGPRLRGLWSLLHEARTAVRDRPLWAVVTLGHTAKSPELDRVLRLFPSTVEVPPLRLHPDDLKLLVPLFLSRLGQGHHLSCSTEAMRLLMRMSWPGNAEQVHQLLREVVKHRRTGVIRPEDLPPEAHSLSRRVLTPLESMERDAIVRCLSDANGNKVQAARSLGMSRATIYRKIHDYGILLPPV